MPLRGFVCPPGVPTAGTRNELEWCLTRCPHPCVAPPLLLAIYEADRQNYHQGAYISASMLAGAGCPRQTGFERFEDLYEHPERRYWPFRGTHAHSIIEAGRAKLAPMGWLQELRMAVDLTYEGEPAPVFDDNGVVVSLDSNRPLVITVGGTVDAYRPVAPPYPLWDFKSMADAKARMFVKGEKGGTFSKNLEDRWVWQTNIYRWLTGLTVIPKDIKRRYKLKGKNFPTPEFIGIQGIAMMHIPRSGAPYTLAKDGTYEIDHVPLLDLEEVEAFVRENALKWYRWLVKREPAPVVPTELKWLCKNCPFNGDVIAGERCFPDRERANATAEFELV